MREIIRNAGDFPRIIAKYFARQWLPGTSSNTLPSSYYNCKTRKSGWVPPVISLILFSGSIDKLFLLDWQIILPLDNLCVQKYPDCPRMTPNLSKDRVTLRVKTHGRTEWTIKSRGRRQQKPVNLMGSTVFKSRTGEKKPKIEKTEFRHWQG